jgi:hypothetical protein
MGNIKRNIKINMLTSDIVGVEGISTVISSLKNTTPINIKIDRDKDEKFDTTKIKKIKKYHKFTYKILNGKFLEIRYLFL